VPGKDRQRAIARQKLERQMARRIEAARKRRQWQAAVGAVLAVVAVLAGSVYLVNAFDSGSDAAAGGSASAQPTTASCLYTKVPAQQQQPAEGLRDVGVAPITGIEREGVRPVTIQTNRGVVQLELDQAGAPCTSNSFTFLAGKKYFDGTPCHRLVTKGIFVLQCGDPSGSGTGGPGYQFTTENLPTSADPAYPAGTLAMARGEDPGSNGSQFFIVYKDSASLPPNYTVFGRVTKGLDVVARIAAAGVAGEQAASGDGPPKLATTLVKVTVGATKSSAPSAPASAPASRTGSPAASPPAG